MNTFEKLIEEFRAFPGIGPRQARRFVYHLLNQDSAARARIANLVVELSAEMKQCAFCMRFFKNGAGELCHICTNQNTDKALLLVVEKDTDADTIEKTGVYSGRFFVLGGSIPILDEEPAKRIRAKTLISAVQRAAKEGLKEVILAMSVNPEGENTEQYVRKILEPQAKTASFKITILGRGLSTGTELEYSDADTLSHALKNRG
ncbi:MAG: toprim domain-containing protein [Patescibacteria group bacterium]